MEPVVVVIIQLPVDGDQRLVLSIGHGEPESTDCSSQRSTSRRATPDPDPQGDSAS
jgi:hypothetical protein